MHEKVCAPLEKIYVNLSKENVVRALSSHICYFRRVIYVSNQKFWCEFGNISQKGEFTSLDLQKKYKR